ncbi:MAG: primosomal protein N' [Oscillospiraceae bacterium]|nr:primosomal protein N' [Oscillospiraceae bacterium]
MPQIAKVAVAAATYAIDKPYDYLAPDEAQVGQRVLVPFGKGNRTGEGVILSVSRAVPDKPLKAVREILDAEPVISAEEIKLALWMRQRYYCTVYEALHTILPAAVWYRYREVWKLSGETSAEGLSDDESAILSLLRKKNREAEELQTLLGQDVMPSLLKLQKMGLVTVSSHGERKVRDKTVTIVRLSAAPESAMAEAQRCARRAPRQAEALRLLAQSGEMSLHDLCYFTGLSRQALLTLSERGFVSLREQEEYRISSADYAVKGEAITLNDEQQHVFEEILEQALSGKAGVTALYGITGSGKTLIYIRLAQEMLAAGKSVMILVPEIVLTPQMMARFCAYFGAEVALLHSGLRLTERYDQYKRIRRGEAHIVLGTRSAVFAPLENIGLIVLDEEQESSYESENAPCYHARDIAKYRCARENARLVLGSATPTVETAYYARRGDYQLACLHHRYNEQNLPQVIVADMRQELRRGNTGTVSLALAAEIQKNIASGEQTILFLNRRGNSRQLLCPSCGYVPKCPRCSVYLTYHSANGRLMCHYCGYSEKAPENCPECGGALKHLGIGTQKVEEELRQLFPGTDILRMDADTVGGEHEKLLRTFEKKKIPILLGTQMVAKGLDFENVTLVGVLAADLSLYVDHYRASERTFSLLTQVVGRAGRGEKTGRAVIQTYTPENDVIQAAAQQDYERFYNAEIRLRRLRRDPPFADQTVVTVTGPEESAVRRACAEIRQGLRGAAAQEPYRSMELEILGPAPAPVVRVNNRYRYRLTVVGQNSKPLRELIAAFLKEFAGRKENRGMHIFADCNRMD